MNITAKLLPLVDWTMGAIILGAFLLICVIMAAVVMNMVNSDKNKEEKTR